MNWYITKLVFHIKIHDGNTSTQFDEQCRLIQANSEAEACIKAHELGKSEEEGFINDRNSLVEWRFVSVVDLCEIKEWKDGSSIYSKTHEFDEPENYMTFAKHKGAALMEKLNVVIESVQALN